MEVRRIFRCWTLFVSNRNRISTVDNHRGLVRNHRCPDHRIHPIALPHRRSPQRRSHCSCCSEYLRRPLDTVIHCVLLFEPVSIVCLDYLEWCREPWDSAIRRQRFERVVLLDCRAACTIEYTIHWYQGSWERRDDHWLLLLSSFLSVVRSVHESKRRWHRRRVRRDPCQLVYVSSRWCCRDRSRSRRDQCFRNRKRLENVQSSMSANRTRYVLDAGQGPWLNAKSSTLISPSKLLPTMPSTTNW